MAHILSSSLGRHNIILLMYMHNRSTTLWSVFMIIIISDICSMQHIEEWRPLSSTMLKIHKNIILRVRHVKMYFLQSLLSNSQVSTYLIPPTSIWPHLNSDENSLCAIVLCSISAMHIAHHNEQFFQVGLLDQALISLGLALSPPSTSVSSDFMVLSV